MEITQEKKKEKTRKQRVFEITASFEKDGGNGKIDQFKRWKKNRKNPENKSKLQKHLQ